MTIILTSEILTELIQNKTLKIMKKHQKNSDDSNYYFTPSIGMNLYKPKVIFINAKFIVFEFDKYECLNLLQLLRTINNKLQYKLKNNYSELFDKDIYNIMSENDKTFTIRCYLPQKNNKYYIKSPDTSFKLPRLNVCLDSAFIEIRNVWTQNTNSNFKGGFNIELKAIEY